MLDTHCHIDLYPKPELILKECEKNGFTVISMTNLPSHFERGIPFFESQKKVRQALGMHPLYAQHHKNEFPKFISNLSKTSYIGEVGLDFSKEGIETKEIQLQSFENILNVITAKKKLLSIHSRQAEKEVLNLLKKYRIENAIFHWYSGGVNLIDEIVQEKYYFSINPAMIKSMSGRKIISKIPQQFVLTETDGPFTIENDQIVKPGEINSIIRYLADEWMINLKEVQKVIQNNFLKIIERLK